MNDKVRRQQDMLEGAVQFAQQTGIVLNARATALVGQIVTKKTELQTLAATQVAGGADLRAGASERVLSKGDVLEFLRGISAIARHLPEETFPGVAEEFRLPDNRSYPVVMATARSFLTHAGPFKATFVEAGMPADFDEQLSDALASFDAASARKHSGRTARSGGTAGLQATAREAVRLVRQLGSIFTWQFRNDPVRLAEWKTASHIERPPKPDQETGTGTPGAGAGTGTGGTTSTVLLANGSTAASAPVEENPTAAFVEPRVNGTSNGVLIG